MFSPERFNMVDKNNLFLKEEVICKGGNKIVPRFVNMVPKVMFVRIVMFVRKVMIMRKARQWLVGKGQNRTS